MASITFSGIASGLDTASLIDKLVAAEKAAATPLTNQQSDLNSQKSIVGSLSALVSSFGSLATELGDPTSGSLTPRAATSSDAHVSVTASADADVATHTVRVDSLAKAQVVVSNTFATSDAGAAGAGSLEIKLGSADQTVSWTASDTLASIASKINDAQAGVSASLLFDGSQYRLVMTSQSAGTTGVPALTETGNALGLADPANVKIPAADAKVNIDGVDIVRHSNVIDDAIEGVTLTLASPHGTTDTPSNVAVSLDHDAVAAKLTSFVSAYNSINAALHVQLDYNGTTKGTDTLFGDSTLRQLESTLGITLSNAYGGQTLGALGIDFDKGGTMTLDRSKLDLSLAKDPRAVTALFVSGGLGSKLHDFAETYTRSGDGALTAKSDSLQERYKSLQSEIDQINNRADALKTQLQTQFTAMEQAISALQGQSAYLAKIL